MPICFCIAYTCSCASQDHLRVRHLGAYIVSYYVLWKSDKEPCSGMFLLRQNFDLQSVDTS